MKMTVFWDVARCSLVEIYGISDTRAASIIRVDFYRATRSSIPEDGLLHSGRSDGLEPERHDVISDNYNGTTSSQPCASAGTV
jgi:hypothetical protein